MAKPHISILSSFILCVSATINLVLFFFATSLSITFPYPPEFQLQSITALVLGRSNTSATTVTDNGTVAFDLTFWIGNPTVGTLYNEANISVFYLHHNHHFLVASSCIRSFFPDHPICSDSTNALNTWVPVTVAVYDDGIFPAYSALVSDLNRGRINLTVKLTADYRWDRYSTSELEVTCNHVEVHRLPAGHGLMLGAPTPCELGNQ